MRNAQSFHVSKRQIGVVMREKSLLSNWPKQLVRASEQQLFDLLEWF